MTRTRRSKQRERLLEILQSREMHVTATWLFDIMRREFPTLSLGNVYRNLHILVDQGEVNRLRLKNYEVYEARRNPHYHFICDVCGAIDDLAIPAELQSSLDQAVVDSSGHRIDHDNVEFHGSCAHCVSAGRTAAQS